MRRDRGVFSGSLWIGFGVGVPFTCWSRVHGEGAVCSWTVFDCAEVELCFWMVDTH